MPDEFAPQVFVSYSHQDTAWREALFDTVLRLPAGDCPVWSDGKLRAGDRWREQIDGQLAQCGIAVLLVSQHFLDSHFINQIELPRILARAGQRSLKIVWVPVALTPEALGPDHALVEIQGASGFGDALPATPSACRADELDRLRQRVHRQVQTVLDPVGADLAELVGHRYEMGQRLSQGNVASIYTARDRSLGREVVIKALRDGSRRQGFEADVRAAIRTSEEPNFVNIYDVCTDREPAHCVLQRVQGRSLRTLLQAHPEGLPVQTCLKVFRRVASALARAHGLGLYYGNLKPSNVMLDDNDEPFILPVGRQVGVAGQMQRSQATAELLQRLADAHAGGHAPTMNDAEDLAYLVPDHFDEFDKAQERLVDHYMLGLLAWQMATGQWPKTLLDVERLTSLRAGAFVDLPPLTTLRPLCPQRFSALVAGLSARLPRNRLSDLGSMRQEVDLHADLSLVMARDSYRRCAADAPSAVAFFARFYATLAQTCPEVQGHFAHLDSAAWARQHRMLKEAVLLLFAFAQQRDGHAEPHVLSRIAESHAQIPARLYPPFVDALVATVCGDASQASPPFDPLLRQHPSLRDRLEISWRDALAPGIDFLMGR